MLCFGSSHSRIEVSPPCHPLSVCVFSLFRQQHPSGVPANTQNKKPQISSSVVEKAKLIRRLHKLEVLYLRLSPNVCFACALLPSAAPVVKGNYSLSVHAQHTRMQKWTIRMCLYLWVRKPVIEVTVQYGSFTLTSKHDLWRHNENCHSSWPPPIVACVVWQPC